MSESDFRLLVEGKIESAEYVRRLRREVEKRREEDLRVQTARRRPESQRGPRRALRRFLWWLQGSA